MAAAMYSETLGELRNSGRVKHESQNYTLQMFGPEPASWHSGSKASVPYAN